MSRSLGETHVVDRIGGLRAAVLGANDGLISTASLMVGIMAALGVDHARLSHSMRRYETCHYLRGLSSVSPA